MNLFLYVDRLVVDAAPSLDVRHVHASLERELARLLPSLQAANLQGGATALLRATLPESAGQTTGDALGACVAQAMHGALVPGTRPR